MVVGKDDKSFVCIEQIVYTGNFTYKRERERNMGWLILHPVTMKIESRVKLNNYGLLFDVSRFGFFFVFFHFASLWNGFFYCIGHRARFHFGFGFCIFVVYMVWQYVFTSLIKCFSIQISSLHIAFDSSVFAVFFPLLLSFVIFLCFYASVSSNVAWRDGAIYIEIMAFLLFITSLAHFIISKQLWISL